MVSLSSWCFSCIFMRLSHFSNRLAPTSWISMWKGQWIHGFDHTFFAIKAPLFWNDVMWDFTLVNQILWEFIEGGFGWHPQDMKGKLIPGVHAHTHNTLFQGMVLHWWLSIDVYCWLDRHSAVAIAKLSLVKEIPPNWNWAHVVGFMSSLHLWHHGCSIWQFTVPSCNAVKQWRA